jgi:putative endonuclease
MDEIGYVYILASDFRKLYIGVTSEIEIRIAKHKNEADPNSHTARYNIKKLVYFERFSTITAAISREKQLKKWSRIKKLRLIIAANPTWQDLSAEWGKPINLFK